MLRANWILVLGLALVNSPAEAMSCREGYCPGIPGHNDAEAHGRDTRSIMSKTASPGGKFDNGSSVLAYERSLGNLKKSALPTESLEGGDLPLGRSKKGAPPPGLSAKNDLPPGLSGKDLLPPGFLDDSRSNGWPKYIDGPPDGPGPGTGALPVPEPSSLGLFGVGLALVEASRRRRWR